MTPAGTALAAAPLVKADDATIIETVLDIFEQAGYYAAVYCSRDFFQSYTNLSELKAFDKWEAAYTKVDTSAVQERSVAVQQH